AEGEAFLNQPVRGDRFLTDQVRPELISIGGDYWNGLYPVGHQGEYWISTENHLTGTLTSDEFLIDAAFPWFSFLIGGSNHSAACRVELLIKVTDANRQHLPGTHALVHLPGKRE